MALDLSGLLRKSRSSTNRRVFQMSKDSLDTNVKNFSKPARQAKGAKKQPPPRQESPDSDLEIIQAPTATTKPSAKRAKTVKILVKLCHATYASIEYRSGPPREHIAECLEKGRFKEFEIKIKNHREMYMGEVETQAIQFASKESFIARFDRQAMAHAVFYTLRGTKLSPRSGTETVFEWKKDRPQPTLLVYFPSDVELGSQGALPEAKSSSEHDHSQLNDSRSNELLERVAKKQDDLLDEVRTLCAQIQSQAEEHKDQSIRFKEVAKILAETVLDGPHQIPDSLIGLLLERVVTVLEVPKDGNCCFASVSRAFASVAHWDYDPDVLRAAVIQQITCMQQNPDGFAQGEIEMAAAVLKPDLERFVRDGEWESYLGDLVIVVLSRIFHCNFAVFWYGNCALRREVFDFIPWKVNGPLIMLMYDASHYWPIVLPDHVDLFDRKVPLVVFLEDKCGTCGDEVGDNLGFSCCKCSLKYHDECLVLSAGQSDIAQSNARRAKARFTCTDCSSSGVLLQEDETAYNPDDDLESDDAEQKQSPPPPPPKKKVKKTTGKTKSKLKGSKASAQEPKEAPRRASRLANKRK